MDPECPTSSIASSSSAPSQDQPWTPIMALTASSSHVSSAISPAGTSNYSSQQTAGPRSATPNTSPTLSIPFKPEYQRTGCCWTRPGRGLTKRLLFLVSAVISVFWWWQSGLRPIDLQSAHLATEILGASSITDGLQFIPASNPKIHYVGRWTATPNHLRMDGTFAGIYLDVTINSTSTILVALHNSDLPPTLPSTSPSMADQSEAKSPVGHLSFQSPSLGRRSASPISLLARIDQEEYLLLPNASALVTIQFKNLPSDRPHNVRIIAPMVDGRSDDTVEFEGLWLDQGGRLLRVAGSHLPAEVEDEDRPSAENANVGEKHRLGLTRLLQHDSVSPQDTALSTDEAAWSVADPQWSSRKKVLEVVTDHLGSMSHPRKGVRAGGGGGLLSGVMGWEYLLGEMFGIDHVAIGVDGMCLTRDCIGGTGTPAALSDVFFRSGPVESPYFSNPWMFRTYIPDVIILNIGSADFRSFDRHGDQYNVTGWELFERFEDAYVAFVRAIRHLAYPKHPHDASASRPRSNPILPKTPPASIPIFVMRPLQGHFEHATQSAVKRLRAEGDKSVFWLDTSGWLDLEDTTSDDRDFFLEEFAEKSRWSLTERGNQRVAIFLHMHVCPHLAQDRERCPFLPPDVYQGKAFDPDTANFDRFLEDEKERKLKAIFTEPSS